MTDIKARLDEIATEAAELNYSYRNERVIRAAIDKALEVVVPLAVERCAERGVWDKRVITSALLEELKK